MDFPMHQCWMVWVVLEAVNLCDEFSIEYQASETAQLKIAHEFENVSKVKFSNCASAIDGILIWRWGECCNWTQRRNGPECH